MMTTIQINTRFTTIATVGYTGSVTRNENRAAHGGVCLLQVKRNAFGKAIGRKINSNGRHLEVSKPFELDAATLDHWFTIGG
jgi:hypothetical protein